MEYILKGILIGLSISVPLGPIGMLTIQRTLNKGRKSGLVTGFGATTSDLLYALVTIFFLSFVLDFVEQYQLILQYIGSIIIVLFGLWIFRSHPKKQPLPNEKENSNLISDYLTSFALTLSNPLILFILIALFAQTEYIAGVDSMTTYVVRLFYIVVGAGLWWFTLTWFAGRFRNKFNLYGLKLLNRITGVAIALIGIVGIVMSAFQ